ncbi:hypothetical protein [Phenylobacterium sp.]|uniref:hypothetical protein n=1 Tax=Phenylobacterium sp. TaxID=1871053 RepID=UPI0035B2D5C3
MREAALRRAPIIAVCAAWLAAAPALGQAPPSPPDAELQPWPYPPPDPQLWWSEDWPAPPEARDPLAGRRVDRWGAPAAVDNGVDPLLYRLWDLPPLQSQILYGDELVAEVWMRPSGTVRQAVARVVLRRDGKGFVQARAGLACCAPAIQRRVEIDAELPPEAVGPLRALADDPLWKAPRFVRVAEGGGAADAVCVDGAAYDLTLMTARGAVAEHRACDPAAVGQAADVLAAVLGAALGHDPRFDVIFPGGADFSREKSAYQALTAQGGALRAAPPAGAGP